MGELGLVDNNVDTEHNASDSDRANNNANTGNADTEYDVSKSDGANNNTDADFDAGKLGKTDKNVNTEHDVSGANNTPDIDRANNVKKEVKVYKYNLFWLLLITIWVKRQDCKAISPKYCPPRHCPLLGVLYSSSKTTGA